MELSESLEIRMHQLHAMTNQQLVALLLRDARAGGLIFQQLVNESPVEMGCILARLPLSESRKLIMEWKRNPQAVAEPEIPHLMVIMETAFPGGLLYKCIEKGFIEQRSPGSLVIDCLGAECSVLAKETLMQEQEMRLDIQPGCHLSRYQIR